MRPIFGMDEEISYWVSKQLNDEDGFGYCPRAIGLEDKGRIIAGVVYHNARLPMNIEMSIASISKKWCTRKNLEMFFNYPFLQLNLPRVTAITGENESHTRDFLERLGFVHEGTLREGHPDCDAVIYGLLRKECKWVKNGQERRFSSTVS
jgi:RimJ/RimL family protein N-acetyltransferase